MRFEDTPDNYKFRIVAEGKEVDVFGAAYRELIHEIAKGEAEGEIDDFILYMASWDDEEEKAFLTNNPAYQAEILEGFYTRTKPAIVEISLNSLTAPYDNPDIIVRYELGKKALEMAKVMRANQRAVEQFSQEIESSLKDFVQGAADESSAAEE